MKRSWTQFYERFYDRTSLDYRLLRSGESLERLLTLASFPLVDQKYYTQQLLQQLSDLHFLLQQIGAKNCANRYALRDFTSAINSLHGSIMEYTLLEQQYASEHRGKTDMRSIILHNVSNFLQIAYEMLLQNPAEVVNSMSYMRLLSISSSEQYVKVEDMFSRSDRDRLPPEDEPEEDAKPTLAVDTGMQEVIVEEAVGFKGLQMLPQPYRGNVQLTYDQMNAKHLITADAGISAFDLGLLMGRAENVVHGHLEHLVKLQLVKKETRAGKELYWLGEVV